MGGREGRRDHGEGGPVARLERTGGDHSACAATAIGCDATGAEEALNVADHVAEVAVDSGVLEEELAADHLAVHALR